MPRQHNIASYIPWTLPPAFFPMPPTHTHTHVHTQQETSPCAAADCKALHSSWLFFSNKCDPRIREGDQCCALKFMGKNGNKIFLSLSLFPSFFPSLSILPTCSPSPFSLFSFPYLSAQHMHAHAKPTCTSDTHTHTHFFSSPVLSLSLSLVQSPNPPTGSSFSASPLLSFILYSLPPPSLPTPLCLFLSVSFSHTYIFSHKQTHAHTLTHPSIFSSSTSGRLWFPLSEIAFSISLSLIMSPAKGVMPPEYQFFHHFSLLLQNNSPFPGNNKVHVKRIALWVLHHHHCCIYVVFRCLTFNVFCQFSVVKLIFFSSTND